MLTTEVLSDEKLLKRQLHVRQIIAISQMISTRDAINMAKSDLVYQLANMIIRKNDKSDSFFWEKGYSVAGQSFLEYGIDVFVLTKEECYGLQRAAFEKGMLFVQSIR